MTSFNFDVSGDSDIEACYMSVWGINNGRKFDVLIWLFWVVFLSNILYHYYSFIVYFGDNNNCEKQVSAWLQQKSSILLKDFRAVTIFRLYFFPHSFINRAFRMTEKQSFVLSFKIDNATTILTTGRAESRVFYEGGFRWWFLYLRDYFMEFWSQVQAKLGCIHLKDSIMLSTQLIVTSIFRDPKC